MKEIIKYNLLICILLPLIALSAQINDQHEREDRGIITVDELTEISGAVAGRINPCILWVHNDSGALPILYALNTQNGACQGTYRLRGVRNHDWEDIAAGPGPLTGKSYLYIADIGDNHRNREKIYIIRLLEPDSLGFDISLRTADVFPLCYPDGRHDAETILVDQRTGDIFIVTKEADEALIYQIKLPAEGGDTLMLKKIGSLRIPSVTAGDISSSGKIILLKNYFQIYCWKRRPGQGLAEALHAKPVTLPYLPEPQGEALAWSVSGNGYYTLSEKLRSLPVHLYFYPYNSKNQ